MLSTTYKKVLHWSLNHKWIVIILSTLILVATIVFEARLGAHFISAGDDKILAITYTPKPGETGQAVNH